ncbi:MAG: tRNA (guanosine(37)-N1)-methyltransferase TrmD [Hydrogenophilus thermoluteolus]
MRCDIVTLFPEMFAALTEYGVTGRAAKRGRYTLVFHNPRDHTPLPHRQVDDRPYGGGPGMVMRPEPLTAAIRAAKTAQHAELGFTGPVIYLSPQGKRFTQADAHRLAQYPAFTLLCGRYEGIDQRVIDLEVDEELSLGDFVLSGGELAAMVVLDATIRLLPGVLGDAESARRDSFQAGLLDHPHYTRPETFEGLRVPSVLLSGNHTAIQKWRQAQAMERTARRRPDLLDDRKDAFNP